MIMADIVDRCRNQALCKLAVAITKFEQNRNYCTIYRKVSPDVFLYVNVKNIHKEMAFCNDSYISSYWTFDAERHLAQSVDGKYYPHLRLAFINSLRIGAITCIWPLNTIFFLLSITQIRPPLMFLYRSGRIYTGVFFMSTVKI